MISSTRSRKLLSQPRCTVDMLLGTKPKRRNRLALPRPKASVQASVLTISSQNFSGQESVSASPLTVTTISSSPLPDHCSRTRTRSSPTQSKRNSDSSLADGVAASVNYVSAADALCTTLDETMTEYQTTFSNCEKKGKRSPTSSCSTTPGSAQDLGTTCNEGGEDCINRSESSSKADRNSRVPFQAIQLNTRPAAATAALERGGQQNDYDVSDVFTDRRENIGDSSSSMRENEGIIRPTDIQRRRRREDRPGETAVPELRKPGKKSRRLWSSGSRSGRPPSPQPTTPQLPRRADGRDDSDPEYLVATAKVDKELEEPLETREGGKYTGSSRSSMTGRGGAAANNAAGTTKENFAATGETDSAVNCIKNIGSSSHGEIGGGSGQRCPVCGSAVWGLSVHARQVHINSCLDGSSTSPVRAEKRCVPEAAAWRKEAGAMEEAVGGQGVPLGRKSFTGVVREPKTEFQAEIQMAKALSKSLLASARSVENGSEEEPQDEEELSKNPAAFRAKEERLVATLKNLDQKLERLQKDRELALKKLAAHRALGARMSAGAVAVGEDSRGAPKTVAEVVDLLFDDEQGERDCVPQGGRWRGEKRKHLPAKLPDPTEAMSADESVARKQAADVSSLASSEAAEPRYEENGDGNISSGGDGGEDGKDDSSGVPRVTRRRSSGGRGVSFRDGRGRLSSSSYGRKSLWDIALDADVLSQSSFVTGVFADVKAEEEATAAKEDARARKLLEGCCTKRGAQTANVTASAYGDASLYNRRPAEAGASMDGSSRCPTSEDIDTQRRDPGTDSGAACGKRRQCPGPWSTRGNDDGIAEQDGAFGGRDTTADEAILLLTQTLSQRADSRQPGREEGVPPFFSEEAVLAPTPVAAAKANVVEEQEKIAARHIARAPVTAVSRLFPDWEENVRFVFHQGEDELRNALESINAALSEEEAAIATTAFGKNTSFGGECLENDGTSLEGGQADESGRTGKAEALLFFEGVILEALELRTSGRAAESELGVRLGSEDDVVEVRDVPSDAIERGADGRDLSGEGSLSSLEDRGDASRTQDLTDDEMLKENNSVGGRRVSQDQPGRGDNRSHRRDPSNAGMATAEQARGVALDDEGAEVIRGHAESRAQSAGDDSVILGEHNTMILAARSPTTATRSSSLPTDDEESATTIVLSGDSCRDAIVTFDLANPSELEREATVTTTAVDTAIPRLTGQQEDPGGRELEGVEMDVAGEESIVASFDSFWDDPLAFPSPPHDDGDVADELHAPLPPPSQPSPSFTLPIQRSSILEAASGRQISSPTAQVHETREEEELSFDMLMGKSRLAYDAAPSEPRGELPKSPPESLPPMRNRSQSASTKPAPAAEADHRTELSFDGGVGDPEEEAMPSFDQMTQQELTGMMSVYGLKRKSKREMVERLKRIWSALHPSAAVAPAASAASTEDGGVPPMSVDADSATPAAGRSNVISSRGRTKGLARADTAKAIASGRPPLAEPRVARDGVAGARGGEGDGVPPCPTSRQRPSSSVRGGKNKEVLGEQIHAAITGNEHLHEDILLLRTVELTATQQLVKNSGVKCSKRDLASFLDDKGITFIDRGAGGKNSAGRRKKESRAADRAGRGTASHR